MTAGKTLRDWISSLLLVAVICGVACTPVKKAAGNQITLARVSPGIYHLDGLPNAGVQLIWSPDGKHLAGLIQPPWPMPECIPSPIVCALFPDNSEKAFSGIYLIDTVSWQMQPVLQANRAEKDIESISWFPDSQHLAYDAPSTTADNSSETRSIDLDGQHDKLFMQEGAEPVWSPDGSKMALVNYLPDGGNSYPAISIFDTQDQQKVMVFQGLDETTILSSPSWSPDGKLLAFSSGPIAGNPGPGQGPQIYVIELATRKVRQLTNDLFEYLSAEFSPVKDLIAFQQKDTLAPNGVLYRTVLRDLNGQCSLLLPIQDTNFAAWSPDGQRLIVLSGRDSYIVDLSEYVGPGFKQTGSICR